EESGLAYNRFRYYDPNTACYLNSDPIGLEGGSTPYFYVQNPFQFIDPFGLVANNILFNSEFWKELQNISQKTTTNIKGASLYKVIGKTSIQGIKKGDYFHMDTFHKDKYEIEVYNSQKQHKGVYDLHGKKIYGAVKGRKCG
ncbi:RHS repeat domain-containing protein, partial [Rodentibacter rarus]|uniref:RHS repeat domain-containing protein n=1 Tax=Rodentibacter rarus TaxID=1908260 RepID=UPI001179A4EC